MSGPWLRVSVTVIYRGLLGAGWGWEVGSRNRTLSIFSTSTIFYSYIERQRVDITLHAEPFSTLGHLGLFHITDNTNILMTISHIFFVLFCFVALFFRAAPVAYGDSQARGLIRAIAAGLHHSHSNTRSELCLRPTPELMATPDP